MYILYVTFLSFPLIVHLYYPSLSILIVQTPGAQLVSVGLPDTRARDLLRDKHTEINTSQILFCIGKIPKRKPGLRNTTMVLTRKRGTIYGSVPLFSVNMLSMAF